ncbi:MAG: PrsW family intramembrane metalloprotease [Pyrinomonadaceae bacterium]|nr:PrsW family intramembrane metalloprotease [Pyrinomonadaceae bacterium]
MDFQCRWCGTIVPEGRFDCQKCGSPMTDLGGARQVAPTVMHSQAAPTILIKRSNKISAMKVMLAVFAGLIALLLGLLVLYLIGVETGPVALMAGLIFATLPVPIYISLILWLDRYESEPLWLLAVVFFWGATVAVFIAFIANTMGAYAVAMSTGDIQLAEVYGAVISAPLFEESAKGLVLFIIFWWKKDEFDGILDGIVYAGMVGLGFAMTENVQYYGKAALEGGIEGGVGLFILRGAIAPFSHPLFTSMTGIGLGWARQSHSKAIKIIMPLLGLGLAMFLHSLWNLTATISGALWLLTYIFIMIPVFVAALVVVIFALRREGRVVREHLMPDFQRGMFTQDEYNRLCSVGGRMGASFRALRTGGFGVWRARMRYNQTASELAFHRSRIARGLHPDPQEASEREAFYLQMLQELRSRLGTH